MNKFVSAFGLVLVGTCLIIGSAQADSGLDKCQSCVGKKCYDESVSCLDADGCMDVIKCISSCKENDACPKLCAINAPSRDVLNKAVILFSCWTTHASTDCSNVCS